MQLTILCITVKVEEAYGLEPNKESNEAIEPMAKRWGWEGGGYPGKKVYCSRPKTTEYDLCMTLPADSTLTIILTQ